MLSRDDARAFAEPFRAEYFPADWTYKLFPHSDLGAAKEASKNLRGGFRRNYGRHEPLSMPKMCPESRIIDVKLLHLIHLD